MQSRKMSAVESVVSTSIGYAVSLVATLIILPTFNVPVSGGQAAGISAAFTLISVVRSYVVRRAFNR